MRRILFLSLFFVATSVGARAAEVVVDFEQAEIGKPMTNWVEKGVTFALAHQPTKTKAVGRIMFFPHLASKRKGILCAMAEEQIPVQMTFPQEVSSVTISLWGSTACPALLQAFDKDGAMVDQVSLAAVPGRAKPEDPVPIFEMSVKAPRIAYVRLSGPRTGEFLAADEVRFTATPRSSE